MRLIVVAISYICILSSVTIAQPSATLDNKFGEYGSKPGQFKYPTMIAVDSESNLYVVDQHNHRIQKFDSSGNFILMWGSQGSKEGEFNYPYGIALDSRGNVFVSDMNNNRVQKFTSKGQFIAAVGSYGSSAGEFKYPYGISIDENDTLYVIDAFNYRIQKFSDDLTFAGEWGSQELFGIKLYMPHESAFDSDGNIILSDRQNHRLSVFTKRGKLVKRFGTYAEGIDAKAGTFSEPHGIAVSAKGNIFITDRYNFGVHMLDAQYNPVFKWNTTVTRTDNRCFPLGIAVSPKGDVYVSDHYAHCITKYSIIK